MFYGCKVIDSCYLDSAIWPFYVGAQNIPANPTEPVYGDFIPHLPNPLSHRSYYVLRMAIYCQLIIHTYYNVLACLKRLPCVAGIS